MRNITALIINYCTLELTLRCVESFRRFYPQINLLIIDNGSLDESTTFIRETAAQHAAITALLNPINLNHGPALHQGLQHVHTPLVLILDSDCQVVKPGFLEKMLPIFDQSQVYAVGQQVYLDRFGYEVQPESPFYSAYIRPYCMLIDRRKYAELKPFIHHGSPGLQNMQQAVKKGFRLINFPIHEFVHHIGGGTCSRYGYNLGTRHKLENILHRLLNRAPKLG